MYIEPDVSSFSHTQQILAICLQRYSSCLQTVSDLWPATNNNNNNKLSFNILLPFIAGHLQKLETFLRLFHRYKQVIDTQVYKCHKNAYNHK